MLLECCLSVSLSVRLWSSSTNSGKTGKPGDKGCPCHVYTRNSLVDDIAERYHVNRATVVKRYQPYTQLPRNVQLISDES